MCHRNHASVVLPAAGRGGSSWRCKEQGSVDANEGEAGGKGIGSRSQGTQHTSGGRQVGGSGSGSGPSSGSRRRGGRRGSGGSRRGCALSAASGPAVDAVPHHTGAALAALRRQMCVCAVVAPIASGAVLIDDASPAVPNRFARGWLACLAAQLSMTCSAGGTHITIPHVALEARLPSDCWRQVCRR